MQVNVFVSAVEHDGSPTQMLVLPFGPQSNIPKHLQHIDWRYFGTVEADDALIGADYGEVQVALVSDGYLVTKPGKARN